MHSMELCNLPLNSEKTQINNKKTKPNQNQPQKPKPPN